MLPSLLGGTLGEKRDHRPLHYHTPNRASSWNEVFGRHSPIFRMGFATHVQFLLTLRDLCRSGKSLRLSPPSRNASTTGPATLRISSVSRPTTRASRRDSSMLKCEQRDQRKS